MHITVQMPRYRCHKEVSALKIKELLITPGEGDRPEAVVIVPEEEGYKPFAVGPDYFIKHRPIAGGYFVVYADGYVSYSPAEPFEAGYARI